MDAQRYCQHPICQANAAEDLLFMANSLGRKDLIHAANDALSSTVRCVRQPRKGPIRVGFAPERNAAC